MMIDTNLNEIASYIHEANVKNGFRDGLCQKGTELMLVVSELSEALEADRKDRYADAFAFESALGSDMSDGRFMKAFEDNIKDSYEDEIADAMIRLFHIAGKHGIDLDFHVRQKVRYNSLRTAKHGKKY